MREANVALDLISRMKTVTPVKSDDNLLFLSLADIFLTCISNCLQS